MRWHQGYITVFIILHGLFLILAFDLDVFPRNELPRQKSCVIERAHKMLGYFCRHLDLRTVPQNLRTNVEILDLSFNRIRDVPSNAFHRYTDVKLLYLGDNMIQHFEPGTFSELKSLEAIDLSYNGIRTVPLELFFLPYLRNLYVYDNNLNEFNDDLMKIKKPIAAPLQILNIANCGLKTIPDFGVLPDLLELNLSSNPLTMANYSQLLPMCNLNRTDLRFTSINRCNCETMQYYLLERGIKYNPLGFECLTNQNNCTTADSNSTVVDFTGYNNCNLIRAERKTAIKARNTWLMVAAGLAGFLIGFIILLYYVHRKNVKETKRLNKQLQAERLAKRQSKGSNEQNVDLLNNSVQFSE